MYARTVTCWHRLCMECMHSERECRKHEKETAYAECTLKRMINGGRPSGGERQAPPNAAVSSVTVVSDEEKPGPAPTGRIHEAERKRFVG